MDTTELKAALAHRKSSGLQTHASDFGAVDTPKSSADHKPSAEVQQLSG